MQKLFIVAWHEYIHHVRRPGFLFATFGMPLLMLTLLAGIFLFTWQSGRIDAIGYIDQAALTTPDIPPTLDLSIGLFGETRFIRYANETDAQAALRAETVEAVFIIPPDFVATGTISALALYGLPDLAESQFDPFLRGLVGQRMAPEATNRMLNPLQEWRTVVLDAPPDAGGPGLFRLLLPFLLGSMLVGATFSGGSYLLMALAQEKDQRILEILMSSISPHALMGGKILGLGALALTQLAIWGIGSTFFGLVGVRGLGFQFNLGLVQQVALVALAMFLPLYLLIAASLAAIGAATTNVQEGQQLAGLISMATTLPMWLLPVISASPNGAIATVLSLIPFTAPITLLQRLTTTAVPPWQILATLVLLWVSALGAIWLNGAILRSGLLRSGNERRFRLRRRA